MRGTVVWFVRVMKNFARYAYLYDHRPHELLQRGAVEFIEKSKTVFALRNAANQIKSNGNVNGSIITSGSVR